MNNSINLVSGILGLFFMAVIVFLFFYAAILILPFIILFLLIGVGINFFNAKDAVVVEEIDNKKNYKKEDVIDAEYEIVEDK